jgi:hypothetical protein
MSRISEVCPIVDSENVGKHAKLLSLAKQKFPDMKWGFDVRSSREQPGRVFLGPINTSVRRLTTEEMGKLHEFATKQDVTLHVEGGYHGLAVIIYPSGFAPVDPSQGVKQTIPGDKN